MAVTFSLTVHCLILAFLALQIVTGAGSQRAIDTFIQTIHDDGGEVGDVVSVDLAPLMPVGESNTPQELVAALENVAPEGPPGAAVTGGLSGDGASGAGEGGFFNLPKGAVQAGSFAAWTTPQGVDNAWRRFKKIGNPGDAPQPGEVYFITIQIKVPSGHASYSLSDLTGEVVGTDKYRKRIPQGVWIKGKDGKLVRPPRTGKLKVQKGVVEIIVDIPGAAHLVEDTIEVHSKLLNERQTLTLTFDG
jgi:hypothetical protein